MNFSFRLSCLVWILLIVVVLVLIVAVIFIVLYANDHGKDAVESVTKVSEFFLS